MSLHSFSACTRCFFFLCLLFGFSYDIRLLLVFLFCYDTHKQKPRERNEQKGTIFILFYFSKKIYFFRTFQTDFFLKIQTENLSKNSRERGKEREKEQKYMKLCLPHFLGGYKHCHPPPWRNVTNRQREAPSYMFGSTFCCQIGFYQVLIFIFNQIHI